jgi:hypothetical protein
MGTVGGTGTRGNGAALVPWTYRLAQRALLGDRNVFAGRASDEVRAIVAAMVELVVERDRQRRGHAP